MKSNKEKIGKILGIALATLIFATLTLPILKLTGVLDLLATLSATCTKFLFGVYK